MSFTAEQIEQIGGAVKTKVDAAMAEAKTSIEQAAKTAAEEAAKNGTVSKDTYDAFVAEKNAAIEKLQQKINEIEAAAVSGANKVVKSGADLLKETLETEEYKSFVKNITQKGEFVFKNVFNIGGIASGDSYSGSAIGASITGTNVRNFPDGTPVYTRARRKPLFTDLANVTFTSNRNVTYFEEGNRTGLFMVTPEGGLKPFVGYNFAKVTKDWKKATGRQPFTEEMMTDFYFIFSVVEQLMMIDCELDLDDVIVTETITNAAPYLNPSMAAQVDNADNYGAIGAAMSQIQLANFNPTFLALNPVDAWKMKLQKGSDGHYVMAPFTIDGQNAMLNVIVSNKVTAGNFFIGDINALKIQRKIYPEVRLVDAADTNDAVRNQKTLIVEKAYYNYIPTTLRPGFVYASFAAVITSIEKP